MTLVKTSFFSAVITLVRISAGFLVGKIVAVITGAAGVALVGQFTNFISIVVNFATGSISNGVVKYTAEYNTDEARLRSLFSTAFRISIYCAALTGILLLLFSKYIAFVLFRDYTLSYIIRWFGGTVIFYAFNTLLLAILNGRQQLRQYTIVNTVGSLTALLVTAWLVYSYQLDGALLALVVSQAFVFFLTAALIIRNPWFSWRFFNGRFDVAMARKLGHYSLMAVVSILTVPVAQILVRNLVVSNLGIDSAGYWQGMMRVSDGYLLIVTTALATYYLPKLSSLKSDLELKTEIFNGFKLILPAVIAGCVVIYFCRYFIIQVLYTADFVPMESLFKWQLIGDVFKIAAFLFGYIMVAKSMTRYYIITEIIFNAGYVILTYFFIQYFKLQGTTIAFMVNYFLCLLYMMVVFRKLIFTHAR